MHDLRISVVGCSGSGKSVLAERIRSEWGLPRLELDSLYHQAGWEPLPPERMRARVDAFLDANRSWVIDGNYDKVRDRIWERATTVLWLDLPRWRTLVQITRRTLRRCLRREVLWNGNRERLSEVLTFDPERSIVAWSWTQHPVYRRTYEALRKEPRWAGLDLRRFSSWAEAERWLASGITAAPARGGQGLPGPTGPVPPAKNAAT